MFEGVYVIAIATAPVTDLHTCGERLLEALLHQEDPAANASGQLQFRLLSWCPHEHGWNQEGPLLNEHCNCPFVEVNAVMQNIYASRDAVAETYSAVSMTVAFQPDL